MDRYPRTFEPSERTVLPTRVGTAGSEQKISNRSEPTGGRNDQLRTADAGQDEPGGNLNGRETVLPTFRSGTRRGRTHAAGGDGTDEGRPRGREGRKTERACARTGFRARRDAGPRNPRKDPVGSDLPPKKVCGRAACSGNEAGRHRVLLRRATERSEERNVAARKESEQKKPGVSDESNRGDKYPRPLGEYREPLGRNTMPAGRAAKRKKQRLAARIQLRTGPDVDEDGSEYGGSAEPREIAAGIYARTDYHRVQKYHSLAQ
mmetsp:Transcript_34032/g.78536  ORF Transcript_34032/g.78536 Transcript_34032/m.78536 type:complete len:263 (+) Transcript_34032:622-1410(+)